MAKTSSIERNRKRERMAKQFAARRAKLKAAAITVAIDLATVRILAFMVELLTAEPEDMSFRCYRPPRLAA